MESGFTIKCLDKGFVRYVDHMGSDERIVEAARISYKSPSKGEEQDKKLIEYLYKNKHTSPFEMVKLTLNVKMPIFVMRQWVRHRMQNLNEVSARYTKLSDEFYIPKVWRLQDTSNKQGSIANDELNPELEFQDHNFIYDPLIKANINDAIINHNSNAYSLYESMIKSGIAREMARMVLPVNIYTEIYSCWDLKNLLHFITLREDSHAQAEIVEYAKAIKQILVELFPWTMEAYEKYKFQIVEV